MGGYEPLERRDSIRPNWPTSALPTGQGCERTTTEHRPECREKGPGTGIEEEEEAERGRRVEGFYDGSREISTKEREE